MDNNITKADLCLQLELRHLVTLNAIAEHGTFWAAADALDSSQSAVSQQLAALERAVGQRLVERSRGRREVAVTEAGRLLLRHAEAIVARLRAAEADLAAYAQGEAGVLRVGGYESIGQRVVPALLKEFGAAWPSVEVRFEERPGDEELYAMLERGELDLTFGVLPAPPGPFESVELLRDPFLIVVPNSSSVGTGLRPVRPRDLRGMPMVAYRTCGSVEDTTLYLRRRGVEPNVVFRTDDNGTLQAAVAAGLGFGIMPRLSIDANDPGVRTLRLDDLPLRTLGLAWHRDRYRSPASLALQETALAVCRGLARVA